MKSTKSNLPDLDRSQQRGLSRRADVELVLLPVAPREDGQRVRLGVEHPFVEVDRVVVCEEEVEVLQPRHVQLARVRSIPVIDLRLREEVTAEYNETRSMRRRRTKK